MGLRRGLRLIRGMRRSLSEDEQHKIAGAIVGDCRRFGFLLPWRAGSICLAFVNLPDEGYATRRTTPAGPRTSARVFYFVPAEAPTAISSYAASSPGFSTA
jgi:hypothetical protein